jgi:large subunit ribosomal protein L24
MANMKIKKGDQVRVMSGKEAGKTAKVLSVDTERHRVVLDRLNIMKKHTKPNPKTNPQGGVIEREAPVDASNVMLVCPACGQPTRVGYRLTEGGGKVRTCRRASCGKDIDKA